MTAEVTESPFKHTYLMLSRMQSDCDYFLGHGNRNTRDLWAGDVAGQIAEMRRRWESLPEDAKPQWLTWELIDVYEAQMSAPAVYGPSAPWRVF